MSILQYPKQQYFLFAETSTLNLGSFKDVTGDLGLFQLRVLNKNASAYSYQMRIVFSSIQGGTALKSTDWYTFSNTTTGQVGTVWLGDVIFDVNRYRLNSAVYLFARLELTGYTRDAMTTYLAVYCDWYEPIGDTNTAAARMSMGVYL